MEVFEEHQRASKDDPRLSHSSYHSSPPPAANTSHPHLPLQLPACFSPAPNHSYPIKHHSCYQGRCSSIAASLKAKLQCHNGGLLYSFFPQRRFVEDSLSQGKNSLPGLPVQHPGKFLRPSLEEHRAALITGRELESAQISLTTLRFVLEPN